MGIPFDSQFSQTALAFLNASTDTTTGAERAFVHDLVALSSDGLLVIDGSGKVVFCNPAADSLFESSRRSLLGTQFGFPDNITPLFLPPRSPEPDPAENIWQYLRQTYLSHRVFDSYEDIVDAACHAWNKLIDKPSKIMSIGMRKWAHEGQIQ